MGVIKKYMSNLLWKACRKETSWKM